MSKIRVLKQWKKIRNWLVTSDRATNISNGALQVKTIPQEHFSVYLHFRKHNCLLKRLALKIISHVALGLTVSEMLTLQIVYLEKVGQCH